MHEAPHRFKGWTRPGPLPPGGMEPEEGETLDYLCGHTRIFQYKKGHRYSTDDLLVAWYGSQWAPRAERVADMGSGIGSVALACAWKLPAATFCTVEAEAISLRLARKSVRYNGLESRFTLYEGDLRDEGVLSIEAPFDLVTGSPPYWPVETRLKADHPQALPARLEVRGDIGDYAQAAARILAPGGLFACVFPNDQRDRAMALLQAAGLVVLRRREALFKEGQPYGLDLFACARWEDFPENLRPFLPFVEPPLVIRSRDGHTPPEYAMVKAAKGVPPGVVQALLP